MIPYLHPSREDEIGICKHVLILFNGERPLQLRLRTIIIFVTKFVKINSNLYPFLWVLVVLKYIFLIFSLAWLFQKSFRTYVRNLLHITLIILNTAKNLRCKTVISSKCEKSISHPTRHFEGENWLRNPLFITLVILSMAKNLLQIPLSFGHPPLSRGNTYE